MTIPRASKRRATNKAGVIKADGKDVPVLLRDASDTGARIRCMGGYTPPDGFRLVVPMEKIDVDCRVMWRRGADCGVRFEASPGY